MEQVLEVYKRPYDADFPVICFDEAPKQLIGEKRVPVPASPKNIAKYDYQYERNGTCCLFIASEPLAGKRFVEAKDQRCKQDFAHFLKSITLHYPHAKRITLVMDNLNTHTKGALYQTFPPDQAFDLLQRFEFVYTPKHGSWLNMAEIEINLLNRQALQSRIPDLQTMKAHIQAWQDYRNSLNTPIQWRFTAQNARIKLKRLYPSF